MKARGRMEAERGVFLSYCTCTWLEAKKWHRATLTIIKGFHMFSPVGFMNVTTQRLLGLSFFLLFTEK